MTFFYIVNDIFTYNKWWLKLWNQSKYVSIIIIVNASGVWLSIWSLCSCMDKKDVTCEVPSDVIRFFSPCKL